MDTIYEAYKNTQINEAEKFTLIHKLNTKNLPMPEEAASAGLYTNGKNIFVRLFNKSGELVNNIEMHIDYKKHMTKAVLAIGKEKYALIKI